MTEMTDHALRAWLEEGPDRGSPENLALALAATRHTSQRPRWSFPERWLPMQLTMARAAVPRPLLMTLVLALLVVALVTAGLWVASQVRRVPPPFGPAGNGLIAYENGRVIYVSAGDGSDPRALNEKEAGAFAPAFSRDGSRLAFWQRPDSKGPYQLIVANADGSGQVDILDGANVTSIVSGGAPVTWSPAVWSPDGASLAFVTKRNGVHEVVIARTDRAETRVIDTSSNQLALPAWSPDGRTIAVREITPPVVSIVLMGVDGSERRTLFPLDVGPENGEDFSVLQRVMQWFEWSPTGDRIAYTGLAYVGVVDLAGKDTILEADPGDTADFNPTWSPDGTQIAYFGNNGAALDIAPADGSGYRRIGEHRLCAGPIVFSPDGRYILGSGWFEEGCAASFFGTLASVDVATGAVTRMDDVAGGMPSWQRLHPDLVAD